MVVKTAALKQLEALFKEQGNSVLILYGRKECEKEQLLNVYCQNKKYFYYRARETEARQQLIYMEKEIQSRFQVAVSKQSYEEYFKRVKSGGPEKLVLVIDEFDRIVKKDDSFWKAVVLLKEKKLYPGPVQIILSTSNENWVEHELETEKKSDYDRFVEKKIKVGDLDFLEVVRAFPEYSVSECIKVYGILGGTPLYINCFHAKRSIKENICRTILSENGALHHAVDDLLAGQLRERSVYHTILSCFTSGTQKLNDIYLKTGFSRAKISVYMKKLSEVGILEKVHSFETGGWENAKKGVYRIRNPFVHFWFYFVYPNLSDFHFLGVEEFYEKHIAPDLDGYLNQYFSKVCEEYLSLLGKVGRLPMKVTKIGTWVGKEGTIDVVMQNEIREMMVGICNWSKPEFDQKMCQKMFENLEQAKIKPRFIFLFSATTFAEEVKKMAKEDERFILVDMNEL